MKIYIKNMLSKSCIIVVEDALKQLQISPLKINLGEVVIEEELSLEKEEKFRNLISKADLELFESKQVQITENIKRVIVDYVQNPEEYRAVNFSDSLSNELGYSYNYLSNLFVEAESITISKYIIKLRIERIKELIILGEHTISEIAYTLHYSSCAHLSNQFKKITGLAPSCFQKLKVKNRIPIHNI